MKKIELGPEQLRIMRIIWDKERATAQEITDVLNESEPTKLVNVQMLLKKMVAKGAVAYDVENRTYIYHALVNDKNVIHHAVHKFIDHVFAGSLDDMVSYIMKNEDVSDKVLNDIKNMIDKKEK